MFWRKVWENSTPRREYGEYHGGHKVHLAGGTFGEYESGKMYLTDEYLIFAKGNKNPAKRWEIMIPINSIVIEQWGVRAESRRKHIVGGGTALTSNVAFGGGVIQEVVNHIACRFPTLMKMEFFKSPYLVLVHLEEKP